MMIYHWRIAALLITFVIGVTNPANATPSTFNIEGNVSEFSIEGLPDYGLSVGDRFSGTLTYQLTGVPDGSYYMSRDMSDGMSYISGFFILEIEVEGKTFSNGFVSSLRIIDDPSGDSFGIRNAGNDGAWTPWHTRDTWFRFFLADNSGTAISSLSLPNQLEIAAWPDAHYVEFSGLGAGAFGVSNPEQFFSKDS